MERQGSTAPRQPDAQPSLLRRCALGIWLGGIALMGVVEFRHGVTGDPQFPTVMQVENQKPASDASDAEALQAKGKTASGKTRQQAGRLAGARRITDLSNIDKVRRFSQ